MRSIDGGATFGLVTTLPGTLNLTPWQLAAAPDLSVAVGVFSGSTTAVSRDSGATWNIEPDVLLPVSAGAAYLSATKDRVFYSDISGGMYVASYGALQ